MKTCKFLTFGCKVNQYETQLMRERIKACGYREAPDGDEADLYVVNSCTVTHRADSDSLSSILRIRRENPDAHIIFTGCLAQKDADKIRAFGKDILILKNTAKERIGELLPDNGKASPHSLALNKGISFFQGHTRAFLKIQDGCNNFCSYCKVPLVRGRSKSKPLDLLSEEARRLVDGGIKELVLCGICLGAYGNDLRKKTSLCEVVRRLEKISGLLRIRLSSIEAKDVSDRLIALMAEGGKLCPHLHIPIQSGDNRILKSMRRTYTRESYSRLIKRIRQAVPGIAITTDVLVGYPGETDGAFKNTLSLVREVSPLRTHVFPYSPRPGTRAARMEDSVPSCVKKSRCRLLREAAAECALEYKKVFVGRKLEVLFEGRCSSDRKQWSGHAQNYLQVRVFSARDLKNMLIPVKITGVEGDFLEGRCA